MSATIPQAFDLAVQHHQAGRLAEAEALYRQILAAAPNHADARHHLGLIAHQAGRHDLAIEWIRQAIALDPNNAGAYSNLGETYRITGQLDEAMASYHQAIALRPGNPEAYNNLGITLRELGRHEEAVAAYQWALALKPDLAEVHNNLANTLIDRGQHAEGMVACHRALALKPDYPEACNNLGNALKGLGQLDEAVAAYRQALALKPDYAGAWINLGAALAERAYLDEAVAAFRHALEFKPDSVEAHNNLGNALKNRGELDEAIAAYRRALQLNLRSDGTHSNLIYTLHLHPGLEQGTVAEEQRRWNRQFGEPLKGSILPHTNDRSPERRLRIGYLSPDFRDHAVAFFLAPLLEAHDHQQFEIFGYSDVSRPDSVTARLRQNTDVWREVRYLSDAQLAESIRQDGIDILVDLTLHTANNRLLTFARKPAPVQVSWLGMPGSTGLETIDYWLTDRFLDPPGEEATGQPGRPFRLPDTWCCCPTPDDSPEASPLPALQTGVVTFASFNNFAKINEPVLALWARVLQAAPGSRLQLLAQAGSHQERARAFLQKCGIPSERCEFLAYAPAGQRSADVSLRRYLKVDIALDPFPYNGMTTSCHALWMGVPVVTRAGASAVSRAGMSLLETIGLPEWVAQSEEEYVRIAVELAGDLTKLAELRATLRPRMAASPLMDAPRFARNMEAAYRTLWRQWCQEEKAR